MAVEYKVDKQGWVHSTTPLPHKKIHHCTNCCKFAIMIIAEPWLIVFMFTVYSCHWCSINLICFAIYACV